MAEVTLTKRIRVHGIVQGVGFRPTVDRHAHTAGISGSVANKGPYVEIYAQGTNQQIDKFLHLLKEKAPKRAVMLKTDVKDVDSDRFDDFRIIESEKTTGEIFISPDIAICDDCKRELFDPSDRRYLHPFINCTSCGPRLTIVDSLPYDRVRTSMKSFSMCPTCEHEYHDPSSRRYDAQPVCCNDCGPEVYIVGNEDQLRGKAAITHARTIISEGGVVAVKGIGGFHLCCDATNEEAVERLRVRKARPMKPFAVMMRDEQAVRRECELTPEQEEILTGHQKPILLLQKKAGGKLCESVAPDNPLLGVMLPYAPIQLLLFRYDDEVQMPDVLVMTSANVSGAPICRTDEDAQSQISNFCDCILSNNRPIRVRADDTVMDFYDNAPYMIRRSRGYAPLPCLMSQEMHGSVLAMGGELKNTFCIGVNSLFYPSAYIGDLADIRTVEALEDSVGLMASLLETEPQAIACDLHPKYNSTAVAQSEAKKYDVPVIQIQHHYAHVLSCMAENDVTSKCIGISFDGTGFGTDETIWGGEVLLADPSGFTRAASITPFLQIGGDAAAKEGWRIATSMLYGLTLREMSELASLSAQTDPRQAAADMAAALGLCDAPIARVQSVMYDKKQNAVHSTSVGRLFDGCAAILGIRKASTFEGEAANAIMFRAMEFEESAPESSAARKQADELVQEVLQSVDVWQRADDERLLLPTDRLVAVMVRERLGWLANRSIAFADTAAKSTYGAQDKNAKLLAYVFHKALAQMAVAAARYAESTSGINTVALSGGCYQNKLLLHLTEEELLREHFNVLRHHLIPPNDGGIGLGQALAAMYRLNTRSACESGTSYQIREQV